MTKLVALSSHGNTKNNNKLILLTTIVCVDLCGYIKSTANTPWRHTIALKDMSLH